MQHLLPCPYVARLEPVDLAAMNNPLRRAAERLRPAALCAFDLMPEQVALTRARNVPGAEITEGDITNIA